MINIKDILDVKGRIDRCVQARRITEALNLLVTLASMTASDWRVTDEIERMRSSYEYMSRYALDGIDDPERKNVYLCIVKGIRTLADRMVRHAKSKDASTMYFDALRYSQLHPEITIASLSAQLMKDAKESALRVFTGGSTNIEDVKARESKAADLFRMIWISYPMKHEDIASVREMMQSDSTPRYLKLFLISALMLGCMEYYDEQKLLLLADIYSDNVDATDPQLSMRSFIAILMVLWIYRGESLGKPVDDRLAALADMASWHRDVKMAALLLLRTRDTEKIAKTMTEEVIPSMLKLRPDIYRKLNDEGAVDDPASLGENPEWEELLERSGLNDKLKKLSEMQEEGSDVMMATFSHLKSYPFFSDMTNWFMPFHDDHSAMMQLRSTSGGDAVADMIAASDFVCSSDRFSMLFSINSLPETQRKMMMQQFEAQNINMAEMRNAELHREDGGREVYATNYIRDLYRFFKLFRRKGEFKDPFESGFNPVDIPQIADTFDDADNLSLIAEFLFRHGYWADAVTVFNKLLPLTDSKAQIYQKMGYSEQKLGHHEAALRLYEQAEMLDASNKWTWRRIAACHRVMGNPAKALAYYDRLLADDTDNLSLTLQKANALAELGRNSDALKLYFKVEFLDPSSRKTLRPIAWISFLTGDYDTSRRYYERVLEDAPMPADMINLGHLEMATHHYHEAIDMYKRAIEMPGGGKAAFAKSMQEDLKHLRAAGVDDLMTGIVIDRLI